MMRGSSFEERNLLTTAMTDLMYQDRDYRTNGVPPNKLLKAITVSKENTIISKKYSESIIQREHANGIIVRMANGNYSLGPSDVNSDALDHYDVNAESTFKMGSSNNSSAGSSPHRIKTKPGKSKSSVLQKMLLRDPPKNEVKRGTAIRVGERRKRAKKVFDPSENNLPSKRKRGRPMGSLNKTTIKKQCLSFSNSSKGSRTYSQKSKSDSIGSSNEDETNDSHPNMNHEISNKGIGGVCSVCRQYNPEKLVGCRDCSNKAHPSCLRGDGMLRLRPDSTWQCPHCKTCVVCIETTDAGVLTVCSICADAYHTLCHTPPIAEHMTAWNQWECSHCQETKNCSNLDNSYGDKMPGSDRSSKLSDRSDSLNCSLDRRRHKSSVNSADSDDKLDKSKKLVIVEKEGSYSPVYREGPKWQYSRKLVSPNQQTLYNWKQSEVLKKEPELNDEIKKSDDSIFMSDHEVTKLNYGNIYSLNPRHVDNGVIDHSIPDVRPWTYHDVFKYFSSYFPEHAHVFKDQGIDGESLIKMRRCDVVHNLGLTLGPALKIYKHVIKLQSRKDDIRMVWL